ncbi:MAG: hypothetical protein ACK6CU_09855 [Deltaproteobacteria bacterium]|jgi:hypothetical protein
MANLPPRLASDPEIKMRADLCVTVPEATSAQLVELVRRQLGVQFVDTHLAGWKFMSDERGRSYFVKVATPTRGVSAEHAFAVFSGGYSGNVAAFLSWLLSAQPGLGCYATVPRDGELYAYGGTLWAPHYTVTEGHRELSLVGHPRNVLQDTITFVGFRERLVSS